jgi:putative peptide zinc metalloprotease protein
MSVTETEVRGRPRLTDGTELIGEFEGSGFKEPPALARRGDGQVIQLTPLLYSVAEKSDGNRSLDQIADEVGREIGRTVTADNVRTLVDAKLHPLGLVTATDGSLPEVEKLDPLLALKFRYAVIPERVSRLLGTVFRPLFFPPVILAALAALVVTDYWVFFHHGVAQATRQALYEPAIFLIMFAALVASAAFHEIGHATGCRYGGADPGRMGCGLYLAWPAFYTDVTDAYRLDRRGRLRTDLGGVYFNVIVIIGTMGLYLLTRWEPLLLLIVVEHIEIVHQLLPIVRLDGYYIVADMTGVPDLFTRMKPILVSLVPGKKADDKVKVLKPWVRVAVTTWVLIVIPALLLQLVIILIQLPRILGTAWDSFGRLLQQVQHAATPIAGVTATIEMVALALPILGIFLMLIRLAQRSGQWVLIKTEGKPALRALALLLLMGAGGLLAYLWVPKGNYTPIKRNEKGTIGQGVLAANPKNISHLRNLTPPPDLSSHDHSTPTTIAPSPTTTRPRYTTQTTSRYTTQTTSRYTTQTSSRYTTQTTSGSTTETTTGG